MTGRICLIKLVIVSSSTHSMMVYQWPHSLLARFDNASQKFIWSEDIRVQGKCVINWDIICALKEMAGIEVLFEYRQVSYVAIKNESLVFGVALYDVK